ncbi:protein of unknown function [Reichenbachiella agariperforans]|uniref:Uncharacterized protein n=1 Tax=Reichenbachiella agariperforans TaxID=156994 RepID=A0A1M6QAB3_REIAG|nr:DNA-binding domain-containing protein [Reichenbachiella agariperforans]SHK17023.1 protein of unknown function [Reichenbachiella agariperforans]
MSSLNYSLYENKLTKDVDNDYIARPVNNVIRDRQALIDVITGPGSILKPTETTASIDAYWNTIIGFIEKGENYRDDFITVKFEMGGVYITLDDRFDRDRHSLVVNLVPGSALSKAAAAVRPTYKKTQEVAPNIETVYDWASDSTNELLSSEGIVEISGEDLKLYGTHDEEGIFFINQANGSEVKAEKVRTNLPSELSLQAPVLEAGEYRMEIRNTTRKGKSLRVGIFAQKFTVS